MPLQRAAAYVEPSHYHIVDSGSLQKPRKIFRAIVRKAVAHGKDPERVRILRKRIIDIAFLSLQPQECEEC